MLKRTVSVLMLSVLIIGAFGSVLNIQKVEASGTIYIRADGSIDPSTAPISTVDNATYILTGNITSDADGIVIERNNMTLDGAGYTVQGTKASGSKGIDLSYRNNVTIKNMQIKDFTSSIYLYESSNNSISENNITNNGYGIYLYLSLNNSNFGNNMTTVFCGFRLDYSSYNSICGNNITNSAYGICLYYSSNNMLRSNTFGGLMIEGWEFSHFVNDVDVSNTVNDKPVYYWVDRQDSSVPTDAGQVVLVNCTRITVQNLSVTSDGQGMLLAYSNNVSILQNNITGNVYGIHLYESSNIGISGNSVLGNGDGIYLGGSSNNSIIENNVTNNVWYGIITLQSSNNLISRNNITTNYEYGIVVSGSLNNVSGNNIISNGYGIRLFESLNNVSGNNIANSKYYGIMLEYYSSNNTISGNNVTNNVNGIWLDTVSNNRFYHNNFVNNTQQAYIQVSGYANFWDCGYPSGGNYWSDYTGVDANGDGIGDNSYVIDADNQDNYPLMQPYHGPVRNLNTGQSYPTIQGAVNNASEGDAILALSGTYYEHVVVNKTVSLIGENESDTIIDGDETGSVVRITANNINFTRFTIQNSGPDSDAGIYIGSSSGNNISDNIMINDYFGIYLYSSSNNSIVGNTVTDTGKGIFLTAESSSNKFYHNSLIDNIQQVYIYPSGYANVWDDSYPSGGNYWSDYTGVDLLSGPYQNETGRDAIGDTPYVIDANNTDHYPLVNPWPDTIPPVISILSPQNTTYPTSSVPLTFTTNEPTSWIGYSLDNQANVAITGNTTLTGLAIGPHNIIVYANDTCGNTGSSDKVYFTRATVHDVAVLNVTASPTETYINQIVKINVTVKNKGTAPETFNVTAYCDLDLIDTQTIVDLAPGSNITMTFSWNTSGIPKDTYTISAEAEVVPGETNTTDNTYIDNTVTILNSPPTIDSFTPIDTTPEVNEGDSLEFTHASSDPDLDPLTYSWQLDSVEQATTQNWTYSPDYDNAGTHSVILVVSDGELTDSQQWNVTVINVNRPPVIDTSYPSTDPTISEGESQEFNVTYSDPDGDVTTVQWYLNGTPTVTTDSYTFIADYASADIYNMTVIVSDGPSQTSHQWTLTVTSEERDIAIINVIPSKNIVGEGYDVSINVTITNQGELTETFNVTVYANTTIIAALTDITLTSGNSTTLIFTWDTSGFAKGNHTISAVADTVPGETDTEDNTYSGGSVIVTIPGDLNGDGTVDIFDAIMLAGAYGSEPTSANWTPNADINSDNIVDIFDAIILAGNYGQTII